MEVCAGLDIGGTNTVFGLVGRDGELIAESQLSTTAEPELGDYLSGLAAGLRDLLGDRGHELLGIGIGAPNGNFYDGTIAHAPNLPWAGVIPLASMLAERFEGLPVRLTNDANAAALGEQLYGGARGLRDFLLITLGTGVGSGLVANGELILGHDGFAGELGHVVVDWAGRACACGRSGCLETYASVPGFVRTAREKLAASPVASLLRDTPELTGHTISAAAQAGDALALEVFEDTGRHLGRALANTVALTSPERIFVFGGLARAGALILEPTQRHLDENTLNIFAGKARLEVSHLMDRNAAILGAAALAWEHAVGARR